MLEASPSVCSRGDAALEYPVRMGVGRGLSAGDAALVDPNTQVSPGLRSQCCENYSAGAVRGRCPKSGPTLGALPRTGPPLRVGNRGACPGVMAIACGGVGMNGPRLLLPYWGCGDGWGSCTPLVCKAGRPAGWRHGNVTLPWPTNDVRGRLNGDTATLHFFGGRVMCMDGLPASPGYQPNGHTTAVLCVPMS